MPSKVIAPVRAQMVSNFGTSVMGRPFEPFHITIVCPHEDSIVQLLASIFNNPTDKRSLTLLCHSAKLLARRSDLDVFLLRVTLFAVAYTACAFGWLSPLVHPDCDPSYLRCLADEINPTDPTRGRGRASLTRAVSHEIAATDKELLNFATFDQLIRDIPSDEQSQDPSVLAAFLRHRHRLMFDRNASFVFADRGLLSVVETMGFACRGQIEELAKSRREANWTRALSDPTASLFFASGRFNYTTTARVGFPVKSVRGVAINPRNNQMVAIAGPRLSTGFITQELLDGMMNDENVGKQIDDWDVFFTESTSDSALSSRADDRSSYANGAKIDVSFEFPGRRSPPQGTRHRQSFPARGSVRPRCIDGHPTDELFVTGDRSGKLLLWDFSSETATQCIKISEAPIVAASFSAPGERVLCLDQTGCAFITNFENSFELRLDGPVPLQWLNADNQFAVACSNSGELRIYDILAGGDPVVRWPIGNGRRSTCLDVWSANVAVGFDDGTVLLFDARMGVKTANLPLHSEAVTCIKYDKSGSFFVTGSHDNSVNVVEAVDSSGIKTFSNVMHEYDPNSRKRGVLSLALSQQAIVACSSVPHVHVWTVNELEI
jgi:hypothetical protein